ncbi:MAG: hypothetical protein HPY71_01550 [Firmicutes bacterium]|nr:hypothetical protein [Bacillota bacterium]
MEALKGIMKNGETSDGLLWREAQHQVTLSEALDFLFGSTQYRQLAVEAFLWLQKLIPYRCGVRWGKDRITFLVGNYRPAAIKRDAGKLRIDMGFAGEIPDAFKVASDVWKTIDAREGYVIVERMPLPLSNVDEHSFVVACERMREVAPKTRLWECNVAVEWPKDKPLP